MTPSVSVALGTRDGAAYIGEQIASILGQSHPVAEIVLSDDASSDDTVAVVEGMLAGAGPGAPRLVVLRNDPALGVTANFEQALSAGSGDLVALCDQDDVWHPDRVAAAVAAFEGGPEVMLVHSDARLVDGRGHALGATLLESLEVSESERAAIREGRALDALIRRNLVTGATAMVRRELAERARPFPADWVHDEWLAVLAALVGRVVLIERPLIDYRQHGSNQIGVARPSLARKVRRVLEPRGERNRVLAERFRVLRDRAQAGLAIDAGVGTLLAGKASFEAARAAMPDARVRRVFPVVRALRSGGYAAYASRGRADAVRDLLQPAGERSRR